MSNIYTDLPSEVQSAIVPVNKTYYDYNSGAPVTQTCEDTVWIPSYREMFGGTSYETSGSSYTSYFTNKASRVKHYSGSAIGWCLRSSHSSYNNNDRFCYVGYDGRDDYTYSYTAFGVALGFCT